MKRTLKGICRYQKEIVFSIKITRDNHETIRN
jgi:hypothetical protein